MVAPNLDPTTIDPDASDATDAGNFSLIDSREENKDCPTYIALSFDGEVIDSDDDLSHLLARLVDAADPRRGPRGPGTIEELTIWRDTERVAAVLQAGGGIVRLDTPTPTVQTPTFGPVRRSRSGRTKQRPQPR